MRNRKDIAMKNVQTLQQQVYELERCLIILTLAFILLVGCLAYSGIVDVQAQSTPVELALRRLAIVDEKGVERVIIATPAPDPIVSGKRLKRNGAVSGILINDRDGNERGRYVTANSDTNGAFLTLDGTGAQVFTAYANPDDGATLSLDNQKGDSVTITTWDQQLFHIKRKEGRL
jgi:hypothetical protein